MKKIEVQDDISLYQLKELFKFVLKKIDLEVDETKEDIPNSIKRHFKKK